MIRKTWFTGSAFFGPAIEHRAKRGTANSTTNEKGTDNKSNNSSEYNHNYYMKNKEKWNGTYSTYSKDDKDFDVDAAARDVIRGKYKNGAERKAALGDDYDLVQKRVNELMKGQKSSSSKKKSSEKQSEPETQPQEQPKEKEDELRTYKQAENEYYNKQKQKKK